MFSKLRRYRDLRRLSDILRPATLPNTVINQLSELGKIITLLSLYDSVKNKANHCHLEAMKANFNLRSIS